MPRILCLQLVQVPLRMQHRQLFALPTVARAVPLRAHSWGQISRMARVFLGRSFTTCWRRQRRLEGRLPLPLHHVSLRLTLSVNFLGCLAAAQAPADIAALVLTQMVAAILARTFPAAVSVRHPNG